MKLDLSRKRRLVFYSGGQENSNGRIHDALSKLSGKKARSLTYIPFSHENGVHFYNRIKKRYKKYGFKKFRYFAADSDFLKKEMNEAFKSDVIYLAGGNTFYFLKHLRESGFLKKLEAFARRGGIVAGLSAGAIIMTPHIRLAGYPPHEGDINEVKLKNLKGLGLVNFEFLPHFTNSRKTNEAMIKYSKKSPLPILACPDGSGVVATELSMQFMGVVYLFFRGKKFRLH
ncbi:MAG: Type 1 glutamine amidotransferase-like domain-containing protein [Bdellovibrionales bacterium]|nr:Type 1 glutamine amidotransferase-like domain-containing protein [Bdellovibrionales bacterium]